jgi:hypothetical protein
MQKPVESVLLGVHADDTLSVFIRNDGDLFQAAKFATHNGVTPLMMTTVMADLADAFGWRQIASASSEVPQPEPHARVLPASTREVGSAAADPTSLSLPEGALNGMHKNGTRLIYERIMRALDAAPDGLRFGELHGVVGRGRSSGQVYGYLSVLVKRKLVIRPSEGLYVAVRRGALPVEPVDSRLSASHPAGKAKRTGNNGGGAKAGRNKRHSVTIEQIIEFVAQHPEGISLTQIGEHFMPDDKERGHTMSNRWMAYQNRVAKTGEPVRMHKVISKNERGNKTVFLFPGPPPS